jgi:hypothetical protein
MKKIYYEKVGRKYVPVAEYNEQWLDSFPKGNHLVMCYPGGSSRRFRVDPDFAPMIAAGRYAEHAMREAIHRASEIRPKSKPITKSQQQAWNNLVREFGEDARMLEWPATHDIAEAGVQAMQVEAEKLMQHASVRQAYEQFLLVCKLTNSEAE